MIIQTLEFNSGRLKVISRFMYSTTYKLNWYKLELHDYEKLVYQSSKTISRNKCIVLASTIIVLREMK